MLLCPWLLLGESLLLVCLGLLCLQGLCWVRADSQPSGGIFWLVGPCLDWSLLLGQEARLLNGLIFLTASLHAAHLVAGITFTPIYVFISRPSL